MSWAEVKNLKDFSQVNNLTGGTEVLPVLVD